MKQRQITQPLLVLVGPTAIGKTALSLEIAKRHDCEIVSVDSMQVYRFLDIGTAKVSVQERAEVEHHLIDIVDPDENYDAARFEKDALLVIDDIIHRGKIPLLTGGTGLYLQAVLQGIFPGIVVDERIRIALKRRLNVEGTSKLHEELSIYDRKSAERIHCNDSQRLLRALEIFHATGVPWSEYLHQHRQSGKAVRFPNALRLALTCPRHTLYDRINLRCNLMLETGLEEEVRDLLLRGYPQELQCFGAIGYRHMINYINGEWSRDEMIRLLARDTRRFAKRQYTWFSKMQDLFWFDISDKHKILDTVATWLRGQGRGGADGVR